MRRMYSRPGEYRKIFLANYLCIGFVPGGTLSRRDAPKVAILEASCADTISPQRRMQGVVNMGGVVKTPDPPILVFCLFGFPCFSWWTFQIFFICFLFRGGREGGGVRGGGRGAGFFIKSRGRGGGFRRGGAGGGRAPGECLWAGGLPKFFFSGAKCPPSFLFSDLFFCAFFPPFLRILGVLRREKPLHFSGFPLFFW